MWPYVLAGIFLFVLLLLFSPLVLSVEYEQQLHIGVRFWFVKITLLPQKEKKGKIKKQSPKKKKKKSAVKKSGWQNLVEKYGVFGAVKEIVSALSVLPKSVVRLTKGARVRKMDVEIAVTGEDAADAAITYGRVCSVVYPFLGRVSGHVKLVRPKLNLYCDYEGTSSKIKAKANLYVSLYRVVGTALFVLKEMIKKNLKK